jgi:hypothetical protein
LDQRIDQGTFVEPCLGFFFSHQSCRWGLKLEKESPLTLH